MPRRGSSGKRSSSGKTRYCITLDSLADRSHSGVQGHVLIGVSRFLNFSYFYRAKAVLMITAGADLAALTEPSRVVEQHNNYLRARKAPERYLLEVGDFTTCGGNLSPEELIEMKEFLKTGAAPHSAKTRKVFYTTAAIRKLAEASNLLRVKIGDARLFAVIDAPRNILSPDVLAEVNRDFRRLARDLGFTEAYVLALSLLATRVGCSPTRARLVLMREKYYTSLPLQVENLCGKRHFAWLYLDLLRGKSDLAGAVASALLTYVQTGRASVLYDIARNMTQSKKLTPAEREALRRLVEHEAGY